jgi:glycosyltransferase involved in cell wall biosynthesis
MKPRLNITHVFGNSYAGDWAFFPLRIWKRAGHNVAAICPTPGPLVERLRDEGISVHIVQFPTRLRHGREDWRCVRQIAQIFRDEQSDVAHFHLVPANLWGRIAAWLTHVPVRVTQWPGPLPLELPISRLLELATVWMDTGIIASCIATQHFYESYWHTRKKVHLIYYGFGLDRFSPCIDGKCVRQEFGLSPETPVVAMIAYMYPPLREPKFKGIGIKGHEILISAATTVLASRPDARFLIVGDELIPGTATTYKPALFQMVHDKGLDGKVIFAGHRADIPSILAAADLVAVPSLSENVGGAVEPLLMEKPVVASRVGGLPDVVIDKQTGFLVPPGDAQALAQAILLILSLPPEDRRCMGQRGRELVMSLFDLNDTVRQQEELYYRLLGTRRETL